MLGLRKQNHLVKIQKYANYKNTNSINKIYLPARYPPGSCDTIYP